MEKETLSLAIQGVLIGLVIALIGAIVYCQAKEVKRRNKNRMKDYNFKNRLK